MTMELVRGQVGRALVFVAPSVVQAVALRWLIKLAVGLEAAKLPNWGWSGFRLGKASRGPPPSQGPGVRSRAAGRRLVGLACSEGPLKKK